MLNLNGKLYNYNNLNKDEIENIFKYSDKDFFVFDTESCKHELNEEDEERVYAWGVGNTCNDKVVYGVELVDFIHCMGAIIEGNFKRKIGDKKFNYKKHNPLSNVKMFCHNLAWDVEFIKYVLFNLGYTYHLDVIVKKGRKKSLKNIGFEEKEFQITENNNIVYGSKISTEKFIFENDKTEQKEIIPSFEIFDSMKIVPQKLEEIAKKTIKIDSKYFKKEKYDYESIRPLDHQLTDFEKEYLYCDVYILKEFIKQFYIPLGTSCYTASSIAFEFFIAETFDGKYKNFEEHFPVIDNIKINEINKLGYKGGWTQSNFQYNGDEVVCNKAVSIDINSSYPSTVRNKPLPFGEPLLFDGDKKCYIDSLGRNFNMRQLVINFDGFKNKKEDDYIGNIQVGAINTKIFNRSGTEYIHTNIIDGKCIGGNKNIHNSEYLYELVLWEFELDNLLENMDFYIQERELNPFTNEFSTKNELKKGFNVSYTVLYQSEIGLFARAVDKCMEEKILGKKTGNSCLEQIGKLKANSFYGKMASKCEKSQRFLSLDKKGIASYETTDINYDSARKYYVPFASVVTAWSRCNLRTNLYKVGYSNVLYFDTDSLYTKITAEEIKEKGVELDKYKLGAWDIEKEYSLFKAIASKKYILKGKSYGSDDEEKIICKCAGLPSEVRVLQSFKSFHLGATFEGKKQKKKKKGGYRLVTGSYTLNNSIY